MTSGRLEDLPVSDATSGPEEHWELYHDTDITMIFICHRAYKTNKKPSRR